jgi:predicted bacteriocin transport accessory protein
MKKTFILVVVICMAILGSCSSGGLKNVVADKESDWEIRNLIKISRDELNEMMGSNQAFYVYFGRPSCPDCLAFYPKFKSILEKSKVKVYYYSTEAKASEKAEMQDFIKPFGIEEIPSVLHIKDNAILKIYDGQNENDLIEFEDIVTNESQFINEEEN